MVYFQSGGHDFQHVIVAEVWRPRASRWLWQRDCHAIGLTTLSVSRLALSDVQLVHCFASTV